jgi:hypothetical protein
LVGVSKHTLYAWKKRFEADGPAGLMDQPKGGPRSNRLPDLTKRTILTGAAGGRQEIDLVAPPAPPSEPPSPSFPPPPEPFFPPGRLVPPWTRPPLWPPPNPPTPPPGPPPSVN